MTDPTTLKQAPASHAPVKQPPDGNAEPPVHALFEKARTLHLKGLLPEAVAAYQAVLTYDPHIAQVHFNMGVIMQQSGHGEAAIEAYQNALRIDPRMDTARFNLAQAWESLNRDDEAERVYRALVTTDPQNADAAYNLGTLYLRAERLEQAVAAFQAAVRAAPRMTKAYNNMGKTFQSLARYDEAISAFDQALRIDPQYARAWYNSADVLMAKGQAREAVSRYAKAIALEPDMTAAHNNMGNAYRKLKRYKEAADCYARVLALSPELPEAHYNYGSVLRYLENYKEALNHLTQAVRLRPEYPDAWNNLALTCKNIGDLRRALTCFNRCLSLDPSLSIARWNRSFVHLLNGDHLKGWSDFESRFQIPMWKSLYPFRLDGRRWHGQVVSHATILVHDEQGLGDTLQFVRYLALVKKRCKRLIFETRAELAPLLASGIAADEIIIRSNKPVASHHYDFFIPLLSLPGLFQTTDRTIPGAAPYLWADPVKSDHWQQNLPQTGLKIGLVWAGRPQHTNDHNRSCRLETLRPLFDLPDAHFISMQKEPASHEIEHYDGPARILNIAKDLKDFSDTAAVTVNLDLLITVDTAVAHLAGALGAPVWVMIPFIADWRWGARGETSPWYPSMRLYRQPSPGNWNHVIRAILAQLHGTDLRRETAKQKKCSN